MTRPHLGWPLVQAGVHAVVAVLLAVVVARSVVREAAPHAEATAGVAVLMALVYAVGLTPVVRGRRGRALAWLVVLVAVWLALLALAPEAVYLAFPLFFLAAHLLPNPLAVLAVAVLTCLAVAGYAWHVGLSFAAALGPVLGALVALATVLGMRAVDRESARRGVLEERERLAREIHDTLAQGFTSIQLLLGAAEEQLPCGADGSPSPAAALVGQARRVATDNLEEARRFVRALSPAALNSEPLPTALDRLAAQRRASFTLDGTVRPLGPDLEGTLLRVTQEALANASRHAAADRIAVTLAYLDDQVTLDIVDDGTGFDPAASSAGFGLASMRSRVERVGGHFSVESAPGAGTAVAISVPDAG